MSLDAGYYRASGLKFVEPLADDPMVREVVSNKTTSEKVFEQTRNIEMISATWIHSLCKTSGGQCFLYENKFIYLFDDLSAIVFKEDLHVRVIYELSREVREHSEFVRTFIG